ncbi:hypothetical protein B484DRAFT_395015 [Ochromonadaceae sp. CCMP2298]|nr:hypothetical protein B484DRAFT_395015 [Ochromonadaceae sp. CCMP2298]
MILHLYIGDLSVEQLPSELKFLKVLISDGYRDNGIASDLFLSENIHSLNNEARDYFSKEFELVSQSLSKKAAGEGRGKKRPKSAPSGRGSVVMSDAVRGKCTAVQLDKVPAKVRPTLMSVGFLTQWPERGAPAEAQKSDRLWRAVAVKKQTVQDVAAEARRRNESTARKQAAIRVEKIAVELRDSGLKEVLRQKEDQIDLLRKTLSHLRLSDVHSHRFDHSEQLLCRTVRARAKASVATPVLVPSVYSTSAKPFSPYRASSLNRSCDSAKSQEGSDVGHLSATFDNDFFSARAEYADKGDQRGGDWLAAARASVHELNISQPIHNLE